MRYLVIHRESVIFGQNTLSATGRKDATKALTTIDQLLEERPQQCVQIPRNQKNYHGLPEMFKPGEEVVICGAYLGMCLYVAYTILMRNQFKVDYHPQGCI